jgi:16S rRNA (guanine1207-N2)-methyltransferase
VFSADGIDPGSAELAAAIKNTLKGHGADLGAGWGWLAAQALQTNDKITQLDLMEAEISALNCARQNVTDPRADFHWCDATQTGIKKRFDFIITNPPFHLSRKADPDLGRAFITTARTLLKPTGQMFLVANKQLAYEATLDAAFGRWEILSQSSQYKIIFARKPLP